jgi:hypothetical protein
MGTALGQRPFNLTEEQLAGMSGLVNYNIEYSFDADEEDNPGDTKRNNVCSVSRLFAQAGPRNQFGAGCQRPQGKTRTALVF